MHASSRRTPTALRCREHQHDNKTSRSGVLTRPGSGRHAQSARLSGKRQAGFEECLRQFIFWATRFENRLEVRGNRTGRGWFKKGQSGNPSGLPKTPPVLLEFAPNTDDPDGADRRTVGNLVVEARKFSGLAVDTLVELTKNTHTDSTRFAASRSRLWSACTKRGPASHD
jgi:hypothetical protein